MAEGGHKEELEALAVSHTPLVSIWRGGQYLHVPDLILQPVPSSATSGDVAAEMSNEAVNRPHMLATRVLDPDYWR